MKLLAIDTATEACSVSLYLNGDVETRFEICPQLHSQKLLPMVDEVLQSRELTVQEMDYLVFGRGPGSFTGVRIATGMIQGLSLGTGLQVVGVSTLATMAQQAIESQQAKHIAVAIDARMGEVYFAQFENVDGVAKLYGEEQVIAPQLVVDQLRCDNMVLCGTGWQSYPELQGVITNHRESSIQFPNAAYMLTLAKKHIERGEVHPANAIEPVYLRDKVTWKKLPGRE